MKTIVFPALLCVTLCRGQAYVEHTFPASLSPGQSKVVELSLCKPPSREFAQYELTGAPGLQFTEVASSGGHFMSDNENSHVKIIWSLGVGGECVKIRISLSALSAGTYLLHQKMEYEYKGERRVAQIEDVRLTVSPGAAEEKEEVKRASQVVPKELPLTRIDSIERTMKDPAKAATHISQLRKDAREARKVGENETREAELEIAEAGRALAQARQNPDEKVRLALVKEAEDRLQQAETNRQVAAKIISLALSLEKNADDLEKAGRATETAATQSVAAQPAKGSSGEVEELKKLFSKSSASGNEPAAAGTDTLFHIQLGAFGQRPGITEYRRAGKVNVINENGLYKVLVGGFRTRDEAVRRRQELAGNGFEGFIVRYAGQRRVY